MAARASTPTASTPGSPCRKVRRDAALLATSPRLLAAAVAVVGVRVVVGSVAVVLMRSSLRAPAIRDLEMDDRGARNETR
jgi:hypothetical protein